MTSEIEDVIRFNDKFSIIISHSPTHLTKRKWTERADFMQEELDEFKAAVAQQDLPKIFDALLDLVYVAKGTAVMAGLPWEEGWDDVQRANMAKVRGVTHRHQKVDVTKPPGWVGPDNLGVLLDAGYDPNEWTAGGQVDEQLCLDDEVYHGEV